MNHNSVKDLYSTSITVRFTIRSVISQWSVEVEIKRKFKFIIAKTTMMDSKKELDTAVSQAIQLT